MLFGRARSALFASDDPYDREAHIARCLGLQVAQVDLDDVLHQPDEALTHLPRGRGRRWLYRGWLLSADEYEQLYEAVSERGDHLVVTPDELAEAAYLPRWAETLEGHTPASVWTEGDDIAEAWELAREVLGPPPWILKDHLKSARPLWHACFVPEGADFAAFARVCEGLLDFRGDRFVGGFVVRRFVQLATLPFTAENRPVVDEHRIVFWNGRPVAHAPYYDVAAQPIDPSRFAWVGEAIESPFFTLDVARLAGGGSTIVELNDGGCSGLPEQLDPWLLYEAVAEDLTAHGDD